VRLARFLQILMVVAASHHFARRFSKELEMDVVKSARERGRLDDGCVITALFLLFLT